MNQLLNSARLCLAERRDRPEIIHDNAYRVRRQSFIVTRYAIRLSDLELFISSNYERLITRLAQGYMMVILFTAVVLYADSVH